MAKLQDLFTQARRAQNSGGMGFLGKNKPNTKARSAALVVEFPKFSAGSAEAVLKAGADGLLFDWDGKASLDALAEDIKTAAASTTTLVVGLNITGGWDKLDREQMLNLTELGINYIILPFNAPARLLGIETKELEKVITVPMRQGEIYPLYIRNLVALDGISAVLLDFDLSSKIGSLTIEDILDYRAVREAVRFPAFLPVTGNLNEADAYTINTLGVQALILSASSDEEATRTQVKALRELLEKTYHDDKEKDAPSLPGTGRKQPLPQ